MSLLILSAVRLHGQNGFHFLYYTLLQLHTLLVPNDWPSPYWHVSLSLYLTAPIVPCCLLLSMDLRICTTWRYAAHPINMCAIQHFIVGQLYANLYDIYLFSECTWHLEGWTGSCRVTRTRSRMHRSGQWAGLVHFYPVKVCSKATIVQSINPPQILTANKHFIFPICNQFPTKRISYHLQWVLYGLLHVKFLLPMQVYHLHCYQSVVEI